MILISHRGNLNGKTDDENKPKYIEEAFSQGFDVEVDVWYIDNQSLWLDIKIILLTVKKVFSQADINADGEATMSKFTGQQ